MPTRCLEPEYEGNVILPNTGFTHKTTQYHSKEDFNFSNITADFQSQQFFVKKNLKIKLYSGHLL
jgi:hypothetical protein